MQKHDCDIAIIGAGIVGIATAYYLKELNPNASVMLLEAADPMALTSAQSGENYRNWWPHPVMTAFTDRSIDLMEEIALTSDNLIHMNRRGYALCTRTDNIDALISELHYGYSELEDNAIRFVDGKNNTSYQAPAKPDWRNAPSGVDVITDLTLLRQTFPSYSEEIKTVVHIRRAGAINGHALGSWMLSRFKANGGGLQKINVSAIQVTEGYQINDTQTGALINAERLVNAAGPFINDIAQMIGTALPVKNTLQQKIAFEDTARTIPRDMPFSIDLDRQTIDWSNEEMESLAEDEDEELNWLTEEMPGAIHCRPEGGDKGSWLKLGWAINQTDSAPTRNPTLYDAFPEIVLRGAARLNPSLKHYYEHLPRSKSHYGGYYTLTDENWPLIGPMDDKGAFVVGALSGFGTMAACAAGDLCARLVHDIDIPGYAQALSPQRYTNKTLMEQLAKMSQTGIL